MTEHKRARTLQHRWRWDYLVVANYLTCAILVQGVASHRIVFSKCLLPDFLERDNLPRPALFEQRVMGRPGLRTATWDSTL